MRTYAISTATLHGFPLPEAITRIAEAGYCEIELFGAEGHLGNWIGNPARARRALESAGITARAVHSPSVGWNTGTSDERARRASVRATTDCFHHAAEVGAEIVICHPNSGVSDSFLVEEYGANWARSRESLSILAERARACDVKMAVENMPARGQRRPGVAVAEVIAMVDGLGDHLGICLDVGHSNLSGMSAADEVTEAGERLLALHLQDNDGKGEDQHLLPGRGTVDWDAVLNALDQLDFRGPRTLEVAGGDQVEAILRELAALRREWQTR